MTYSATSEVAAAAQVEQGAVLVGRGAAAIGMGPKGIVHRVDVPCQPAGGFVGRAAGLVRSRLSLRSCGITVSDAFRCRRHRVIDRWCTTPTRGLLILGEGLECQA